MSKGKLMKAILVVVTFILSMNLASANAAPLSSPDQDAHATLMPFLDALAQPPSGAARAFQIHGRVEAVAGVSFDREQPQFELAVEAPGRMRLQFPLGNTLIVACRNQQRIWASPGAQIQALLAALPGPSKGVQLRPIQIPFTGKQLEIIPSLLQIQSKGDSPLDGTPCRVVDIRLLPQLALLLPPNLEGWALRMWISPQNRPARLGIQRPGGSAVIRVDGVHFAPALPPELWQAPADAVEIPAARLQALLDLLGQSWPKAAAGPRPN